MTTKDPKPKPLAIIGSPDANDVEDIANHPLIGADYKALFGWLCGSVSKADMLDQNPDLRDIV